MSKSSAVREDTNLISLYSKIENWLYQMEMEYGDAVRSMEEYWHAYEMLDAYDCGYDTEELYHEMEDFCYANAS